MTSDRGGPSRRAGPPVPRSAADVGDAWLRACLGLGDQGARTRAEVERIGEGFGLSSALLRVWLDDPGAPRSVVVKLWSTDAASGDREARVLRELEGRPGPRVPACYHSAVDAEAGRAVMVLEDFGDTEQGDATEELPAEPAVRLARALARLHAAWWDETEAELSDWLPRSPWLGLDREWFPARAGLALERFGDRLSVPAQRMLERLADVYGHAIARLEAAPVTLLHDDIHLDNVVFDRASGEPILLDWARAALGPAALDLAELAVMVAEPAATDPVLEAYREELGQRGLAQSEPELEREVAAAAVVCFVKGTCGVARWRPESPREALLLERIVGRAQRGLEQWRRRDPELLA